MTREEALKQLGELKFALSGTDEQFSDIVALEMAIKALDQEPCEDCIRRSDVGLTDFEIVMCNGDYKEGLKMLLDKIEKAPSVIPQPKTGHWEWVQYDGNPNIGNWHCSECRHIAVACVNKNDKGGVPIHKYCPSCGAKMVESQESEDKE